MLSVTNNTIMLNVIMLSVVMLNVVAPFHFQAKLWVMVKSHLRPHF
jgi:hypothetical protein